MFMNYYCVWGKEKGKVNDSWDSVEENYNTKITGKAGQAALLDITGPHIIQEIVFEKLKTVMSEKDIQRNIDTLIATQIVRRIGPEVLQNNESHTELPDLPENLKSVIENL